MPKGVARLGEPTLQIRGWPVGPSHHHGVVFEDRDAAPKMGPSVAPSVEDVIPNNGSVGARILSKTRLVSGPLTMASYVLSSASRRSGRSG